MEFGVAASLALKREGFFFMFIIIIIKITIIINGFFMNAFFKTNKFNCARLDKKLCGFFSIKNINEHLSHRIPSSSFQLYNFRVLISILSQ